MLDKNDVITALRDELNLICVRRTKFEKQSNLYHYYEGYENGLLSGLSLIKLIKGD